jgi:hypothetical protein
MCQIYKIFLILYNILIKFYLQMKIIYMIVAQQKNIL